MKTMTSAAKTIKTALMMTGSELMSGDIIDSNSNYLSQQLMRLGVSVSEKVTVGDDHDALCAQIIRLYQNNDLLIINGGLGPTQDDISSKAIASATQQDIITHPAAKQHILDWCQSKGYVANQANLKQAQLPAHASIFSKAPGSAAAFYLFHQQCLVIATPGVPSELKHITEKNILPFLNRHFCIEAQASLQRYSLFGIGESRLQEMINSNFKGIDECLEIGFRACWPQLELKFRNKNNARA